MKLQQKLNDEPKKNNMSKLKILCYIVAVGVIIFTGCNSAENKKKVTMAYAERRISFIVLKADYFANYDSSSFKTHENSLLFLNRLQEAITNIANPEDVEFFKREKRYDTVFDYTAYANAQLNGLKKRIDTLSVKKALTEDDIEFLKLTGLYLNCAAYFNDSWYISPEINFSENFYHHFFQSKEKKLFEHYLYDGDATCEFRLSIANKYPGKYDYIPSPHIIDKPFATELLELLKTNDNGIDDFLSEEANFFKEILEGVVNDKYVLIIKTYM